MGPSEEDQSFSAEEITGARDGSNMSEGGIKDPTGRRTIKIATNFLKKGLSVASGQS